MRTSSSKQPSQAIEGRATFQADGRAESKNGRERQNVAQNEQEAGMSMLFCCTTKASQHDRRSRETHDAAALLASQIHM